MLDKVETSVIIVSYNGVKFLGACLSAVFGQSRGGFEVILVDNGSTDGTAAFVMKHFPEVKLLPSRENVGFAAANNLGIRHARGEYLVLLNNDTVVDREWLAHLVAGAADSTIGAVGSKMLFLRRFLPITFIVASHVPRMRGKDDVRSLGFRLQGCPEISGADYNKVFFDSGFYPEEDGEGQESFRWASGVSRAYLPYDDTHSELHLSFSAAAEPTGEQNVLTVLLGSVKIGEVVLAPNFQEFRISLEPATVRNFAVDIINNAGSYVRQNAVAGDIGFGEVDNGQFDKPGPVESLCGGSVLLKRKMLAQIGLFDERYFMYFEDTDLFWRAAKMNWKLWYEPLSVVRHVHAGTSKENSYFFRFYVNRNRYLVLLKNGLINEALKALIVLAWRPLELIWQSRETLHKDCGADVRRELISRLATLLSACKYTVSFLASRFGVVCESRDL